MTGRVAIVPPRFGADVVGGAEALLREVATGLSSRGWDIEVLTTCARDHYTWANDLAEGVTDEDGVTVRRFPTVSQTSLVGRRAQDAIQEGRIPPLDEQVTWLSWRFTVPDLFHHLVRVHTSFDAIVFAPYLFWTTTVCMPPVADRAVVVPCLHDETYARLNVIRPVLSSPARVWFLSEPEHQLAHRLGPVTAEHLVTGAGITIPTRYDAAGFRDRYGIVRPFILYAGRRERDKGWDELMNMFEHMGASGPPEVDLVTIGVGKVTVPGSVAGYVHDLGFLPEADRDAAFAAALAYVQPSRMESFSRSVMEAWLAGTPVLTTADSDVVTWHCERSGGGLSFCDEASFVRAVARLRSDPAEADAMASRGRQYVLDSYRWDAVLDRMEADLLSMRT